MLEYSDYNYVFFKKSSNVELKYMMFFKKLLKKIRHNSNRAQRKQVSSLFIPIRKNYSYSKKSKNARMGKGKGAITRYIIRVNKFKPFIYFIGCYPRSIEKLSIQFSNKTRILLKSHLLVNTRQFSGLGSKNYPYNPLFSMRLV